MNADRPRIPAMPRRRMLALMGAGATLPASGLAQGFAGLGLDADGYALPQPDYRFSFPRDHGPHPRFRIEWWYITANLTADDGRPYGVQWTLFRNALSPKDPTPGWGATQAWMGHAALTTPERQFFTERIARGGIGQAGVRTSPFDAWIDEWRLEGSSLSKVRMHAAGPDFSFDLSLRADRPFVPQGRNGYSVKSDAGQASHYYSQPFYTVRGALNFDDRHVAASGRAWLDREWSSQPLAEEQTGWDWFSLHLQSGEKLMGYRLREASGGVYFVATWIAADGTPRHYDDGRLTGEPLDWTDVAGRSVPTAWKLAMPDRGLAIEVRAINDQAWMGTSVPYWEGPVRVSGSHRGVGYLEMTGYE